MPHNTYSVLAGNNHLTYWNDPDETAKEIICRLGIPASLEGAPINLGKGKSQEFKRFGAALKLGPFLHSPKETGRIIRRVDYSGQTMAFGCHLKGRLVKLHLKVAPFDTVIDKLSISEAGEEDDQKVYHRYRAYTDQWEQDMGVVNRGLHLVFIDGRSHLGLTYTTLLNDSGQMGWERRYVITLRGENHGERGELHLTFYTQLEGEYEKQLAQFLDLCGLFDEIAKSVRYASPVGEQSRVNIAPVLVAKSAWLLATYAWIFNMIFSGEYVGLFILACMLPGLLFADLLLLCFSPLYRRLASLSMPLSQDLQDSGYSRFSNELLMWLGFQPFWVLFYLFIDLIATLKKSVRQSGNIWIPGPSLLWLGFFWWLSIFWGVPAFGILNGSIIATLGGVAVGGLFVSRYLATKTKCRFWRELKLS